MPIGGYRGTTENATYDARIIWFPGINLMINRLQVFQPSHRRRVDQVSGFGMNQSQKRTVKT